MSDVTGQNRLGEAPSPYLRQHADNPVNWQPWDEPALAAAKERDVPIFLSIGYAACHWCHVMAEESFADEEIAAVLNENFVPIKVDREERPDVDDVYMSVHQMVRGGGGWPLSVFLTPDLEPFYVGTYLPPNPRPGHTGFQQLCTDIAEAWQDAEERGKLEDRAAQWATAVAEDMESVPSTPTEPSDTLLDEATASLVSQADREHGGFGTSQKFPQSSRIGLLLRAYRRRGDEEALAVATETLDAMAEGGLRDHLGGGFHRYCTDRTWVVPHFEKMLYDNASLAMAYLAGYRTTARDTYAEVTRETLEFMLAELRHSAGGFFSTLDARSGEEEGRFYVWTPAEVRSACEAAGLDDPDRVADRACQRWGIDDAGDVEGRSVLTLKESVSAIASAAGVPTEAVTTDLESAQEAMLSARAERERPPRDEKILAGWNGLAISALAEAGLTLEPRYATAAQETLEFIQEHHWNGEILFRRWRDGDRGVPGYLQDYAYLARGALDVFQATGTIEPLEFAVTLTRKLVDRFYDPDRETLYSAAADSGSPLARPQELRDSSTPASTGVALEVLLALDQVAPAAGFGQVATAVLARHGETIERSPSQYATVVGAADRLRNGVVEVTVTGSLPHAWEERIGSVPEPDRIIYHRPAAEAALEAWVERLGAPETPAVWADRGAREDIPTVYVCRRSCSPPLDSVDQVVEWLNDFA